MLQPHSAHRSRPRELRDYVFGVVLVNDWSARDIQAWEYVPLGPFLGKSFATSISPWVVPLDALEHARVPLPEQQPSVLPYLRDDDPWCLDIRLEVKLNGTTVSRPPFATQYWSPGQQLAHLTVNGASLRVGDLFASGTVTGPERDERGSFLELSWGGREPFTLDDGSERTFLVDGDAVSITGWAPGPDGTRIGFGSVDGVVAPLGARVGWSPRRAGLPAWSGLTNQTWNRCRVACREICSANALNWRVVPLPSRRSCAHVFRVLKKSWLPIFRRNACSAIAPRS